MTTDVTTAPSDSSPLTALVSDLRRVHGSGRTKDIAWRRQQLEALSRFCDEREADIAAAIGADLGRNAFDSWLGEIAGTQGEIAFALKNLKKWMKPRRQAVPLTQRPASAQIRYEPLGVVLVVGPWNYPVFLCLSPLVAAIAAGNCVVLKPSELAPATSAMLAEHLPRYLDPDAVKIVEGDGAVTQELLSLGFDHALFTGGTEIGKKIMAGAAATLTPVTLELGGKSPVIVEPDADLGVVSRRLAWVKLMNSGQTCIAPDYVLVHNSVKGRLVEELRTAITEQQVEQPEGLRIVNDRQLDRLASYLKETEGAVVLGGGTDAATLRMQPTVIVDPAPSEPAMTDEIFGPILPIVGYDSVDEAIAFVNGRPKPLALYVFTKDRRVSDRVVDAVPAGGAVVNHIALHCLVPSLPFGGVGASGMGAYHGEWGFQALSHRKAVLRKTLTPDLRIAYPPYGEKAQRLMRRIF